MSKVYGNIEWSAEHNCFTYTETITHCCTEKSLLQYKALQENTKAAEAIRDSQIVTTTADSEIDWVDAGLAKKI